jgi:transposase
MMRVAWRTVGEIVTRVWADIARGVDLLAGLRRIGIDEISYKKGYKYLTVVVDHDTGRLVWIAEGRNQATLHEFFDALGKSRCAQLVRVSADGADWIRRVVRSRCLNAQLCADPFHVIRWATDALDEVRRWAWNQARDGPNQSRSSRRPKHPRVHPLKKCRYALWKNPENLTDNQHTQLKWVQQTNPTLWRAYLLKEGLRTVFTMRGRAGIEALDRWISWARRCRIPAFVDLQRRITRHRVEIEATLRSGLSQGLIESTNTKIRVLARMAYGFHGPESLMALAMLALSGHGPRLPSRSTPAPTTGPQNPPKHRES